MNFERPLMAAGGMAGMAGSSLLTQLSDILSAPRRGMWSALGLPTEGNQMVGQQLGLDPDSGMAHGLGLGAEMLLDPMNLLTMGVGGFGGKVAGEAMDSVLARGAAKSALTEELQGVTQAGKVARRGVEDYSLYDDIAANAAEHARPSIVPSHADVTYRPSVLDQLPEMADMAPKTYNRVDPAVAARINDMGIGSALPGGGAQVLDKPGFAAGRGGVLKPAQDTSEQAGVLQALGDATGMGPVERSPVGPLPGGYMDTLTGPGIDGPIGQGAIPDRMQRQALEESYPTLAGSSSVAGSAPLAKLLPDAELAQLSQQLGPQSKGLLDMAAGQAFLESGQQRARLLQALDQLSQMPTNMAERFLMRMGMGG